MLALASRNGRPWDYRSLSKDLGLSLGEVSHCLGRAAAAGLYDAELRRPRAHALSEFIVHGVRYCFAAAVGRPARGVPTCHAARIESPFGEDESDVVVWPHPQGTARGVALEPLYPSVPAIVASQKELYRMLVLVDFIRIGRARERNWAAEQIIELLQAGSPMP